MKIYLIKTFWLLIALSGFFFTAIVPSVAIANNPSISLQNATQEKIYQTQKNFLDKSRNRTIPILIYSAKPDRGTTTVKQEVKNYVLNFLNQASQNHFIEKPHSSSNFSSGYLPVSNGKIYYQTKGQGDPIIVIHGGAGLDETYLLPQMEELAKNHQVIFYDQRGSGKSIFPVIDSKSINTDAFVQDIERIRQTVSGHKKIILVGHSWGGMLAMLYSIKYPEHTQAMILMNSAPATAKGFHAFTNDVKKRMEPIQDQVNKIMQSQAFIQGNPAAYNNFCHLIFQKYLYNASDIQKLTLNFSHATAKNQMKIAGIFNKSLFETNYDIRPQLAQMKVTTLVIHGDVDPVPIWTARETANSIPGAKLAIIKKCGHFSYVEKPKAVFTAINRFIEQTS